MAKEIRVDVKENKILEMDASLLSILLKDNSSGKNLIWATDNYAQKGFGYGKNDHIDVYAITGANDNLIKPRTEKTKQEQLSRVRDKAEVFTPSWICNKQNNLVDNAWFGRENAFNTETEKGWTTNIEKVTFPDGKTWQDYVKAQRLEITCGEAPYLASRYDTVMGEVIPVKNRIGLLDRKQNSVLFPKTPMVSKTGMRGRKKPTRAFMATTGREITSFSLVKTYSLRSATIMGGLARRNEIDLLCVLAKELRGRV